MDQPIPRRELVIIIAAMVLLVLAGALIDATQRDIRLGFDEVAQVSYIAAIQRNGAESLTALRLLNPASFRFTDTPNYLNHPAPYYWVLAHLGPPLEGQPAALLWYRIANTLLMISGLIACLQIGSGKSRLEFYAYCIPLVTIPVLAPLAGAVNNDNAAFCGGAIAITAMSRLLQTGARHFLFVAAGGLVLAGWAKLTGLLLAGGMITGVASYLAWRKRLAVRDRWTLIAVLALAALPYLILFAQYGSFAPETAAQRTMLERDSQDFGWAALPRLSFPDYATYFAADFFRRWLPGFVPQSATDWTLLLIPVATIAIAVFGIAASIRRMAQRREHFTDIVVAACTLAALATFVLHITFSYQRHLATGWMLDAYPRYYLPIVPLVPLAGLSAAAALPVKWRVSLLTALAAAPLLFLTLGQFVV